MRAIARPLQEFLSTETHGGVLLLVATVAALIWANAAGDSYRDLWSRDLSFDAPGLTFDLTLVGWVNEGLMALFFFVVGLEIKRELLRGELASPRRAALPVAGALGGMVIPVAIFLAFNAGREGARGWGIPMATDIAFAVGALSLLGPRVPLALKVFLLALAIVDDIGAIVVIAAAYTDDLSMWWLAAAVGLLAAVAVSARFGVRAAWVYAAVAIALWVAVHESGVHATIAGVALAFVMPVTAGGGERAALIDRLEHQLHPWTGFLIVPLFALANAGVDLGGSALRDAGTSPVSLGAAVGLMAGKPLGITLACALAVRAGLAALPDGVSWRALAATSMVAGIGFTVSLFIATIAFGDARLVDDAKVAVLAGSALSGCAGLAALWWVTRAGRNVTVDEPAS